MRLFLPHGGTLNLEDDDVGELYVEVFLEPQGALSILPSAWRETLD